MSPQHPLWGFPLRGTPLHVPSRTVSYSLFQWWTWGFLKYISQSPVDRDLLIIWNKLLAFHILHASNTCFKIKSWCLQGAAGSPAHFLGCLRRKPAVNWKPLWLWWSSHYELRWTPLMVEFIINRMLMLLWAQYHTNMATWFLGKN